MDDMDDPEAGLYDDDLEYIEESQYEYVEHYNLISNRDKVQMRKQSRKIKPNREFEDGYD